MKLTESDERIFDKLHTAEVFRDIEPGSIDIGEGAIHVSCGDCDEVKDLMSHFERCCVTGTDPLRIHEIKINGGPLSIPDNSPLLRTYPGLNESAIIMIRRSAKMKGIRKVVFHPHGICGEADDHGLALIGSLQVFDAACQEFARRLPDLELIPAFHVRHVDDRRRTHLFSPRLWREAHHRVL